MCTGVPCGVLVPDPLGSVGPPWIIIFQAPPMESPPDWDLGNFEATSDSLSQHASIRCPGGGTAVIKGAVKCVWGRGFVSNAIQHKCQAQEVLRRLSMYLI